MVAYKSSLSGWAVGMAQLADRSLPVPEILRLNPDMSKILSIAKCVNCNCLEKMKITEKEAWVL